MIERKVRLAAVGLGKMGLLHASILNRIPNAELVALVDKSALMNRLYKKIFAPKGIAVLNNIEKLRWLDIDAAYVTTPISSHSLIAEKLFEKGITRHMFVEKTLASNYHQAKKLCDLAKNSGGITMVGYMKRFSAVFEKAKELLTQGNLGQPFSFIAYAYSSDFLGINGESKSSAARGGALRDIGCHSVDLALWLFGDLEVCDILSSAKTEVGSETAVSFTTKNCNQLHGQFNVSQSMLNYRMPEFGLDINCPKGRIEVNDDRLCLTFNDGTQKRWYKPDLNDTVNFFLGETEYYREDEYFVNSVLGARSCEPSFATASKVDYLIDQVRKEMLNSD